MSISILIADDHKIVREGLTALISRQKDMEVIGIAGNGLEAVEKTLETKPQIVTMDISMPDMNGIEATQKIIQKLPETRIIAMSMHSDKHSVTGMLQAGACGFLLKDCAFQEVMLAIKTVIDGHIYLSPVVVDLVVGQYLVMLKSTSYKPSILTAREIEVLQYIAEGKSTKEIAFELNISYKTVETYLQRVKEKLDIHTIAGLIKYAIHEGITSLEP